ncbi:hypothetical protein BV20DRAFT_964604 [Pilatotrama ljubarskyi]|nr:hypothetical protein BV20DRAFT_964604 [Pilatotrama ljubarskyi]
MKTDRHSHKAGLLRTNGRRPTAAVAHRRGGKIDGRRRLVPLNCRAASHGRLREHRSSGHAQRRVRRRTPTTSRRDLRTHTASPRAPAGIHLRMAHVRRRPHSDSIAAAGSLLRPRDKSSCYVYAGSGAESRYSSRHTEAPDRASRPSLDPGLSSGSVIRDAARLQRPDQRFGRSEFASIRNDGTSEAKSATWTERADQRDGLWGKERRSMYISFDNTTGDRMLLSPGIVLRDMRELITRSTDGTDTTNMTANHLGLKIGQHREPEGGSGKAWG